MACAANLSGWHVFRETMFGRYRCFCGELEPEDITQRRAEVRAILEEAARVAQ